MELEIDLQFEANDVDTISITIADEFVQSVRLPRFRYIKQFCCKLVVLLCIMGILFGIYSIYPTQNSQNHDHITTIETNIATTMIPSITTTTIMPTTTASIATTTETITTVDTTACNISIPI